MKKWLIILISMLVVGGIGSAVTSVHSIKKTNTYLDERRMALYAEEDLLNTESKINTIKINSLIPDTVVRVRKATDNKVTVKTKSVYGENIFKSKVEDNSLIISAEDIIEDFNDSIYGNSEINKNEFDGYDSTLSKNNINIYWDIIKKDKMKKLLDLAAASGLTLRYDFSSGIRNDTKNNISVVEISIPESVNFEFNYPMIFGKKTDRYDIENGLIKEYVKINKDIFSISSIKYNGKVDKVILDSNIDEIDFDNHDIQRMKINGLSISKLIINTNSYARIEMEDLTDKLADEIIVNMVNENNSKSNNKGDYSFLRRKFEDDVYDEVQEEINDSQEEFIDVYELDDYFSDDKKYEKFVKDLDIKGKIRDDIDLFREDIKNKKFSSSENDMKSFNAIVSLGNNVSDKFTINADNKNIRVGISNLNVNLDIKAEKIDMKYILFGKVPSSNILKYINQKDINSTFYDYLNKMKSGNEISVGKIDDKLPTLVIRAKQVRLIENENDIENDVEYDD